MRRCPFISDAMRFRCHARRTKRPPAAFTLLELLLVLGLLVVIGAILVPVATGPMRQQTLRKSGDLMRSAWSNARVSAMRTGLIHVFQYMPDTQSYVIRPWVAEQDAVEGNPLAMPMGNTAGAVSYDALVHQGQLPDGVIFVTGSAGTDLRWQMHLAEEGANNMLDGSLSPPIVFYPDGTTSDAQIWLSTAERQYFISIHMRGMTGVSRLGPLLSAEEMP